LGTAAAHLAIRDAGGPPGTDAVRVYVGTGLGAVAETAAFLENMFAKEGQEPMPARFINSVHNSIASRVAIEFGFRGQNLTFSHDSTSFELALHRAAMDITLGRAKHVLTIGVDALGPYATGVCYHRGWWRTKAKELRPMAERDPGIRGTMPGEGAMAMLLSSSCAHRIKEGQARVRMECISRPSDVHRAGDWGNVALPFITEALASAGGTLHDVDCVLLGANGDIRTDSAYHSVVGALSAMNLNVRSAVFKHLCGEFCTASALGLGFAASLVMDRGPGVRIVHPNTGRGLERSGSVLLYHLYPSGVQSTAWITSR
jgi:3-oxoacyl-(acyl-carrier-protein) synthase